MAAPTPSSKQTLVQLLAGSLAQNESLLQLAAERGGKTIVFRQEADATLQGERNLTIILISLQCVLNGPLGVKKITTLKDGKQIEHQNTSIAEQCFAKNPDGSYQGSSADWRRFCKSVAQEVKNSGRVYSSPWKDQYGDIWPLAEKPTQ